MNFYTIMFDIIGMPDNCKPSKIQAALFHPVLHRYALHIINRQLCLIPWTFLPFPYKSDSFVFYFFIVCSFVHGVLCTTHGVI